MSWHYQRGYPMSNRFRAFLLVAASALAAAPGARAQIPTDPRWRAWLGCWATDSSSRDEPSARPRVTCVVPVTGSDAVDALTIVRGQVVGRDRIDTHAPHAISRQGCEGMEVANWSSSGRRVFLRADYTCGADANGAATTIFAMSTTGEWLRIDEVRSAGGALVSVERRHHIGLVAGLPPDAATSIGERLLAINTARAAAAAPVKLDEIVDALHSLTAGVVRSWIVASNQRFLLDGGELASLARADVPPSVLQAIMGASATMDRAVSSAPDFGTAAVLNAPAFASPQGAVTLLMDQPVAAMSTCPPTGCYVVQQQSPYSYSPYPTYYAAPVVRHGSAYGWANRQPVAQQPSASQPVGIRAPAARPQVRAFPAPPRPPVVRRR